MRRLFLIACLLLPLPGLVGQLRAAAEHPAPPTSLQHIGRWLQHKEFVEMLTAILKGELSGGGSAWFHPGTSRYTWSWLLRRLDANHDGRIQRGEWPGSPESFRQLDRDHDGQLSAADLDWSDQSPLNREIECANRLFRRADANQDGVVSSEEWQALFDGSAGGKGILTRQDVHALLFPPPNHPPAMPMPSRLTLLRGLLSAELGSALEGPKVGQDAPDFSLPTQDGKQRIRLRDFRGKKPVVLIFGSFT